MGWPDSTHLSVVRGKVGIRVLGFHRDPYPVIALHLSGIKEWNVCSGTQRSDEQTPGLPLRDTLMVAHQEPHQERNETLLDGLNLLSHHRARGEKITL